MIEIYCISENGYKSWFIKGTLIWHREDGPAVEYANGSKYWYQHDKRHRLDGPAVELCDGRKEWWIRGIQYNQKDFEQYIKLMAFE